MPYYVNANNVEYNSFTAKYHTWENSRQVKSLKVQQTFKLQDCTLINMHKKRKTDRKRKIETELSYYITNPSRIVFPL